MSNRIEENDFSLEQCIHAARMNMLSTEYFIVGFVMIRWRKATCLLIKQGNDSSRGIDLLKLYICFSAAKSNASNVHQNVCPCYYPPILDKSSIHGGSEEQFFLQRYKKTLLIIKQGFRTPKFSYCSLIYELKAAMMLGKNGNSEEHFMFLLFIASGTFSYWDLKFSQSR